jgi:heme-degrading monooxygenase HmoA
VIVRISSIAIPKAELSNYCEHVRRELPQYEGAAGLDSIHVLQREFVAYVEITTLSLWDSEEALRAFLEAPPVEDTPRNFMGIEFEARTYTVLVVRHKQEPNQGRNEPC